MQRRILEREPELAALTEAARAAAGGAGRVVLVSGEAGIGKSSLLQALRPRIPVGARMLVGRCDDLATPRILGPFRDLIGAVGGELTDALRNGTDRDRILTALRDEFDRARHLTVLAVEDVHWADEASMDVLRYLARRAGELPLLLLLTYRDDELGHAHPLRQLLGLVAGTAMRLPLRRLSAPAVRELSRDSGVDVDAAEIYAVTAGNPFFVHEVLASGGGVPRTVVDAVLARLRTLDTASRQVVEQLSVVPTAIDRRIVNALVPDGLPALAAAEERGLLTVTAEGATFRHELTRRAIADALPATRRTVLNARVLAALLARPDGDLARIVHHAAEAGDEATIVRYGPPAARAAAEGGAHREAAAHYRLVLEHRASFSPAEQADLFERSAIEAYTTGDDRTAVDHQRASVGLRRRLGDPVRLGSSLRWLSRILWWSGDRTGAEDAGREAIITLEDAGDLRMLAMAYSNRSQLDMLARRTAEAITVGERAIALARRVGDAAVLSHALNNVGSARMSAGDLAGRHELAESLRVALAAGEVEHACRAYDAIAWTLLDDLRPAEAAAYVADGTELAERAEHIGYLQYLSIIRGRVELAGARWDQAIAAASSGLDAAPPLRCAALIVIGRALVRTGRLAAASLEETWALACRLGELQRTAPAASVLCEEAWLRGDLERIREVALPVFDEASRLGDQQARPELSWWLTTAGVQLDLAGSEHPYALQATGHWRKAAKVWDDAGYPYESAAALAESPDRDDRLAALSTLDAIGARPLAQVVRRRLREAGIPAPRGPAVTTRENPAGLTTRQVEVLALLAEGMSNAEIAAKLVVSVRTAGNHVAAVLDKLGVHTRTDAATRGRDMGIGPTPPD